MKTYQWTTEDIANLVENEGLDYAIMYHMSPEDTFEDEELKAAWLQARAALFEIDEKLKEYEQ